MSSSCLIILVSNSIFILSLFSFTIHAHRCTDDFWSEAHSKNLTQCKRYKHSNGVEFGWNFDNTTQTLQAHGILNIIGWGVILPIGVIIARYFKKGPIEWNGHEQWKYAHMTCQTIGYVIGSVGWVLGIWLGTSSKYYSFPKHGAFGISIFTFATLQTLALRLKPHKGDELHTYWSIYHLSLGYALLIVICVNIFKGIKIMQEEDKWRPAYIVVIASLAFIFFVFEIINWLQFKVEQLRKKKEMSSTTPHKQIQ